MTIDLLQEDHGESPDLHVQGRSEEALEVEWFLVGIGSVTVDPSHNEGAFLLAEEPPGFVGPVREVDEEDQGQDADYTGDLPTLVLCRVQA